MSPFQLALSMAQYTIADCRRCCGDIQAAVFATLFTKLHVVEEAERLCAPPASPFDVLSPASQRYLAIRAMARQPGILHLSIRDRRALMSRDD